MNRIIFTLLAISASIGSPLMAQAGGLTATTTPTLMQQAQTKAIADIDKSLHYFTNTYGDKFGPTAQNILIYANKLMKNSDVNSVNILMNLQEILSTTQNQLGSSKEENKPIFKFLTNLGTKLLDAPTTVKGFGEAVVTSNMILPPPKTIESTLNRNSNAHLDFTK